MNEFFNSFFEIGYSSTRSCQQQRQKTKKIKENLWKKGRLRNWKIRDPGILLALSLSKMHQKNVLVHALFRDPLRKPCRWFLPKIACFEPLKIQKIFIKISIINPKLYKYYNLQQILKIRWKTKLENPSKRATFAKNSPNSAHRLRISLNFISVKWSRPPRSGSRNRAWTLSKKIASNCCFLPLKIEEKLKRSLHCLAVPTEIRTGNFFILP